MSAVNQTSQAGFKKDVLESGIPVLVDFYATWCGPCRALAPVLDTIAADYSGRLSVVKVNVDDAPQLAASYRVQAVPTLVIFKDGKAVETIVGAPSASALRAKLDAVAAEPEESCGCGCSCCG